MERVVILGSGMAAFGAAHRLREEGLQPVLYDKNPYVGGHTASFRDASGFVFDDGPHISFTQDTRIQDLFARSVGQRYETIQAKVNNHWKGHWIKHPAQCNLHGLPEDLVVDVLKDFIDARGREPGDIRHYADWLTATYGESFARTFPMEYGLRYHTTTADNMTTDWLGPRLYRPDLDEVLRGALSPRTPDVHYVSHFRYPTDNGFVTYLDLFREGAEIRLGHEVVGMDTARRVIRFADGTETGYDRVVSSIPLPDLVPMVVGAPPDVREAARRLAYTTCVTVNIGVEREDLSEHHWVYFYDRDYFFVRLSFPHLFSPKTVPAGAGSIQAECYYSNKYRPLDRRPDECIGPVVADLERCGILRADDRILFSEARLVRYANVIFDLERPEALGVIHAFLEDVGIAYAGRYCEWGPHWTDESFVSGEQAAQRILDGLPAGSAGKASSGRRTVTDDE